jgi:group I intron endonuclease
MVQSMSSGIYRIDLGNGHFYLGSSKNLDKREKKHKWHLERGDHHNSKMQNCWNKYQIFTFVILQKCEISELLLLEQNLIDKNFSNPKNINLTPTAGSKLGYKTSAETRAKISLANKGKVISNEAREKMAAAKRGKVVSEQTRLKISESLSGRVRSDQHRKNNASANKGKVRSPESRQKMVDAWVIRRQRFV